MATQLELIAEKLRQEVISRNTYNGDKSYSSVNKNALSDGDESGKGTGIFLDTINGGSSIDIVERKNEIKVNEYQPNKPYTTPSA